MSEWYKSNLNSGQRRPSLIDIDEADHFLPNVSLSMDTVYDNHRLMTNQNGDDDNDFMETKARTRNTNLTGYNSPSIQQEQMKLIVPNQINQDRNIKSLSFNSSENPTFKTIELDERWARDGHLWTRGDNRRAVLSKNVDDISINKDIIRRSKSTVLKQNLGTCKNSRSFSASEHHIGRLNTRLLDAIERHNDKEVLSILNSGANPNATCHKAGHISACHAAAYANSYALHLLLQYNVEKYRIDTFGRTPLHLAAWGGNNRSIAMLLDFPINLEYKLHSDMTPEVEKEIEALRTAVKHMIDVKCELPIVSVLPRTWKDGIEHMCRKYMAHLPKFFSGWTPLHIASFAGNSSSTRLLLAAGADPNSKDAIGRTPLDIVGAACYLDAHKVENYLETVKSLIEFGGRLNMEKTTPANSDSALHIAVKMCNIEAIKALLAIGAPITQHNAQGNTPLHECVSNFYVEPLEVLANHTPTGQTCSFVDVTDTSGYTVLHKAILTSWVLGVCVALDAGADITLQANNGFTAVHLAARNGNFDILNEVLNTAQSLNIFLQEKHDVESILLCAIRSGNLDCVQRVIDTGASTKLTTYTTPSGITITEPYHHRLSDDEFKKFNMIVHATSEVGHVDILEFLISHNKELERLLLYRCPFLRNMIPIEFSAFHNRIDSFKFLLNKTLQICHNTQQNFDPSVLLDTVVLYSHEDILNELIKRIPNAVYTANEKGFHPLHSAVKFSRCNVIIQLIENGGDLSQCDLLGNTPIDLLMEYRSRPTEFISSIFDGYIQTNDFPFHNRNCEITVDYSVLIPRKNSLYNEGQMYVLKALLKTGNNEHQRKLLAHPLVESFLYLKWKTFATFFYIMLFLYTLFVMSICIYIVSVFYYKDKHFKHKEDTNDDDETIPAIWNPMPWQYIILYNLTVIVIQELSSINLASENLLSLVLNYEFWVKIGTYVLAVVMPQLITVKSPDTDWRRHLATLTLVFAWLNIMLMLSKTPISGYYMQMFWKVSIKIIKIIITFLFLILMFSFCFMIEFHTQEPFESPWAAFIKTVVMMTSEFDYGDTFNKTNMKRLSSSIQMLRVIFIIFLILTAIVLMNLMIGVAVHDVSYLVLDGNLRRLEKQIEFLNSLEISRGKKTIFHKLGLYRLFRSKEVPQKVTMKLAKEKKCHYPRYLKESLMNKALEQCDKKSKQAETIKNESKLDEIHKTVIELREQNLMERINELTTIVRKLEQAQPSQTEI